jgi:dihydroorotase
MKLLIKNGHVVDPANRRNGPWDILIEKGRIAGIGRKLQDRQSKSLNAEGLVVVPGLIDMHVHLREPGREDEETIETGTRAAAAGGFTGVLCMPNTDPVNDCEAVTHYITERARNSGQVHVYPCGAITKGQRGESLSAIGEMKRRGIVAVSDDGRSVTNAQLMRRAMEYCRALHIPVIDHCEDPDLSAQGVMNEGPEATRLGLRGINCISEDIQVARDVLLAEITGCPVHIAHISSRRAVQIVREAKSRRVPVTADVTPHHLLLTDECVRSFDTNFKMNPPLRGPQDVEALIMGVEDGTIDCIASDHAPHSADEKALEFDAAPFGVIGLETSVSLMLHHMVQKKIITLSRYVELATYNPSRILGLPGGKLSEGSPADLTLLDLHRQVEVRKAAFKSLSRNTPFEGWKLVGAPVMTLVAGHMIWARAKD